jgi:hypothetical protein
VAGEKASVLVAVVDRVHDIWFICPKADAVPVSSEQVG